MIAIRPLTAGDRPAVWSILEPIFRAGDTYAIEQDISATDALSYWVDSARQSAVAVVDGEIVGSFTLRDNQRGGGAHVCNCGYAVTRQAQGRGVARQMCLESQRMARELGYEAMQFNFVVASNTRAVALWTDLGFRTVGTLPNAFEHPSLGFVDAFVMHKLLT